MRENGCRKAEYFRLYAWRMSTERQACLDQSEPFDTEQQRSARTDRQGLPDTQTFAGRLFGVLDKLIANWPCGSAVRRTMGRIMPEYRICYVTPDEHIATAPVRIVCENDLAAVQYAQSLHDRNSYQIWQARRLVARETRRASYLRGTAQRRSA
jgi:hypothetical protein